MPRDAGQYRVCRYADSNWEFWMPKRRVEMLAVQNIGPIYSPIKSINVSPRAS